jgi:hypothetical protein
MAGPGSRKMGGGGIKAGRPPTPMAGSGLGAPKGGLAAGMGAPPMAPKVANVRPPGLGAGAPGPMPGGSGGPPPSGPPPAPAGGMGGSGGFAKGGPTGIGGEEAKAEGAERPAFRKGGAVGGDTKARHKGVIHKGRG